MKSKRLAFGLAAFALLCGMEVRASTFDEIVQKGELSFAVYQKYPPFSEEENGQIIGIDADIATEIAARMKLRPLVMEFRAGESSDDDLRNFVWKGNVVDHRVADVMLHVPIDRVFVQRNTNVVIFGGYYRDRIVEVRNPEKIYAEDGLDAFTHESVGVELATMPDVFLTGAMGGKFASHITHFTSIPKAVTALKAGEVSAVIGSETEIYGALGKDADSYKVDLFHAAGLTKTWWELGLAVKDNNHQLADALDDVVTAMRKDGSLEAIFKKHGVPYVPPDL